MGESVRVRCPRTPFDVVAVERPELRFPASCDTWACEWCGPRIAARRTAVLAWAQPERFVTLTLAPTEWQPLRQKVRRTCLAVRKAGYRVEWAWTVERGSKTGMVHVHALQHGQFIPQLELQKLWGAIVDIRRVRAPKGAALYTMKEAQRVAGYATKGARSDLPDHLALNGGRGYHMSRRYLRGKSTREVERILSPVDDSLHWITVPAGTTEAEARAIASGASVPIA